MEPSNSSFGKVRSQRDAGIQTVIGFEDDARRLVEQLMGGKKQLQFISVVGMAGLGKTTLVRKVFDEPSVDYHFYVRAWTTVTQKPTKRDLILGLLKSGFNAGNKDISDMELSVTLKSGFDAGNEDSDDMKSGFDAGNEDSDDMKLGLTLKRRLSGQRYLVVLDDIWDSKDWNDLMLCFPDDNVGSRIVFTTRLADVPLQVQAGCYLHPLRFLNEKESWDLLRHKVFLNETCPSSLVEIGKQIATKCHGLPLSIVVIAGILANDITMHRWSKVAREMNSSASTAPEQYMDTLVLSYNHLPDHLKPCFLYFAAFPEDYEIPARKLILLWVAEGFIKMQTTEEDEGNMLEEVAAHYLKDLITRSLIIVSKSRSNGGIKSCIVHDALRDLCIRKADELNFLHQIPTFDSKVKTPPTCLVQRLYSQEVEWDNFIRQLIRYFHLPTPPTPMVYKPSSLVLRVKSKLNRLSFILPRAFKRNKHIFRSFYPNVQTILASSGSGNSFVQVRYTNFDALRVFKFLRVMDLSSIGLPSIPLVIGSLIQLRYIALCIKVDYYDNDLIDEPTLLGLSASINRLKLLQTFIVHSERIDTIRVLQDILSLNSLRHLIFKGKFIAIYSLSMMQTLSNLQTLSLPIPLRYCEHILEFTPNLGKLCIIGELYLSTTILTIYNLAKLQHLESLSLQNYLRPGSPDNYLYRELSSPSMFPVTLKKLTLVCTFLKWDEMQKIGMLPNLEVLKLQREAFRGEHWETNDGGFGRLKYLSLKYEEIVRWSAYSDQFPNLQHLKLDECKQLREIPIGIGDIYTLEMIEIRNCHPAAVQSARRIKKDQMNKGNDLLKVSIFQA